MKDPLDTVPNAYQVLNDEAARQGLPIRVDLSTKGKDIRGMCSRLEQGAADPAVLQDAYDRLTQPARRVVEDIYYYYVGETTDKGAQLDAPDWQFHTLDLPDAAIISQLIQPTTSLPAEIITPIKLREVRLGPHIRYDEVLTPIMQVEFDK